MDGLRYRGYLPHFDGEHLIQFVTWRLADSLPVGLVEEWARELDLQEDDPERLMELQRRIEKYLDRGHGEGLLAQPRVGTLVQNALLHFDATRYRLLAWVIMPNHVHIVIETLPGHALAEIMHSWKSFTANAINRTLGRQSPLWFREYFDRFVRSEQHLAFVVNYVHNNPVTAGLVARADQWPFSSAAGTG